MGRMEGCAWHIEYYPKPKHKKNKKKKKIIKEKKENIYLKHAEENGAVIMHTKIGKKTVTTIGYPPKRLRKEYNVSNDKKNKIIESYINLNVEHKMYGKGKIINQKENGYIIVKFQDVEKKFMVPEAFDKGFLKLL